MVAAVLASTTGRRSAAMRMLVPRRTFVGDGTDDGQDGERLEPVAVGAGRLLAALRAAVLRVAVGLEVLAEDDVVGDDEAVDAGRVGGTGPVEEELPAARVVLHERRDLDRDLGLRRHGPHWQ